MKNTWCLWILLLLGGTLFGQSSYQVRELISKVTPQQLDSLSILPGSVYCIYENDTVLKELFKVNYIDKTIAFNPKINGVVQVYYLRINLNLTPTNQSYDSIALVPNISNTMFSITDENPLIEDLFGGNDINKRGSVSRGITFGNRQSLGINSTLNLELSGKLSEDLHILASVSDANIPIQPDGNTNKLQEFDQVFIQLYTDKFKLTAGDFWINRPDGYFLNYKKRGQGLTMTNTYDLSANKQLKIQSSVGLSKGKFQRQIIPGVENNQGPYRLVGAENEPFIVVLSGTERVFIDGRLLQRGQEFDYTIDYNSAELVFTSRNLITKDVRIVVEFQYADQAYTRGLIQQHLSYRVNNTTSWINYYQEQDLKNQPLQLSLNETTKQLIAAAGDSLSNAFIGTIDSVGFQPNQNLYRLVDSLGYDSVLVFSVHPDSATYRATFLLVGANKGNYVLDKTTAFGPVYKWVSPLGGLPQGSYMPIQRVNSPKRKRMITAGIQQKFGGKWVLETEFSASEEAVNLFASKDRSNDWGLGNRTKIMRQGKVELNRWNHSTLVESEYLGNNFSFIEPYRAVEFDRDWNIRNTKLSGPQWNGKLSHKIQHDKLGFLSVQAQHFTIGNAFNGTRIYSDGGIKKKGLSVSWDGSALNSTGVVNTRFIRHRLDASQTIRRIKIGIKDDQEFNLRDKVLGMNSASYAFYDIQGYLQNADSSKAMVKFFYRERFDWKPDSTGFTAAARGTTIGGEVQIKDKKGGAYGFVLGLRNLTPLDSGLLNITPDQSIVGRINVSKRILNGALTFDTYYEVGSGLEQKRSFIYLEVNSGQGVYTWIDYNNDGVKDLNEFETATFIDQANYIRIFTPSNAYQKTYSNEYNQSLFWRPELIWNKKTGVLKLLSTVSNQLRIRSTRKLNTLAVADLLNPLNADVLDNALISSAYSVRNSLYLFRTSAKFNGHYIINKNLNKSLLATGFDAKAIEYNELMLRWNVVPSFSIKTEGQQGNKTSSVDYTQGRNYQIHYQFVRMEFSYQPSTNYRMAVDAKLSSKTNEPIYGAEKSNSKELGLEFKYNTTEKGSIQGSLKYLNLTFNGNPLSPVAFEMLEALRPGSNYTWSLNWQRNVGKNLQLNLVYSGRKPAENKVVHNGGMELRAFF
ncbi:MAG: hypothetical protein RLZZ198_1703 [Bacteroidota bacterium]|jgi:hypothetical protein